MRNCEANVAALNITIVSGYVSATLPDLVELGARFNAMSLIKEGEEYFTESGLPLTPLDIESIECEGLKYMAIGVLHRDLIHHRPYPKASIIHDVYFIRYAQRIFPSKNPDRVIYQCVNDFTLSPPTSPSWPSSMIESWFGPVRNTEPVSYNCNLVNKSVSGSRWSVKMPHYFVEYVFARLLDSKCLDSGNSQRSIQEDYASFAVTHFIEPIGKAIAHYVAKTNSMFEAYEYKFTDLACLKNFCHAGGPHVLIYGGPWLDCSLLDRFTFNDEGRLVGMTVEPDECSIKFSN
jgi:hypothetical protein